MQKHNNQMNPPVNPQNEGEHFATYLNGTLLVEVSITDELFVKGITNYIRSCGITVPVRVFTISSGGNASVAVPTDLPILNQKIEIIRATSLDELIALASRMIEKQHKISIDGRVSAEKKIIDYDEDSNPILLRYYHLHASKYRP